MDARFASGPPYYIISAVAQASVSRQSIQEALAALDAQQIDPVRDASFGQALAVARNALLAALAEDSTPEVQHVTALIADLSGYTAIAERMDAEQVREAINAMWLELDGVIAAWGGRIEQHAGDSLVALFGLPWARSSDGWQAVQAAQALQLQLAAFNARVRDQAEQPGHAPWYKLWPGPEMRIGVHEGSVTVSAEAGGNSLPVTGDALRVVYELEEAAPPGAILVSSPVRQRLQESFHFDPPRPRRTRRPSFLVGSPKPSELDWRPGQVAEVVPRLIGRTEALDDLESAFQRAAEARTLEIVTVIGETGSGKSRLVREFLPRLQILAPGVTILQAAVPACEGGRPYALLRDMVMRQLDIYPSHSRGAIQARIANSRLMTDLSPTARAGAVATLEQLLLPGEGSVPTLAEVTQVVELLIRHRTGEGMLIVVVDDLHRADAYSLAVVDNLLHASLSVPVLFIGQAQPSLLERSGAAALSWLSDLTDPFLPATRLDLPPLSAVESRLLAAELMRPAAPMPQRLIDLVVAEANGNPWAIEETVKYMIDLDIIHLGTRRQFDLARAEATMLPRTMTELAAARVGQRPENDRRVLSAAAVVGTVFWDTALFTLLAGEMAEGDIIATLDRLTEDGWLYHSRQCSVGDAQAYVFSHALLPLAVLDASPSDNGTMFMERLEAWRSGLVAQVGNAHWIPALALLSGPERLIPGREDPLQ